MENDVNVKQKSRDHSIDVAKGIAIFLVILGHTKFIGRDYIYLFHMPLFFFLSGMVYNEKYDEKPVEFILKKIKSLYVPYVLYNVLYILIHNMVFQCGGYGTLDKSYYYTMSDILKKIVNAITMAANEQMGGVSWFFLTLFEASIGFNILRFIIIKVIKKQNEVVVLLGVCIATLIGNYIQLPRMLDEAMILLFFLSLGYFYKRYKNMIKMRWYLAVLFAGVLVPISKINYVDLVMKQYANLYLLILAAILGIYLIIFISTIFQNSLTFRILGKNSGNIAFLHTFVFKIVSLIIVWGFLDGNYMRMSEWPTLSINFGWVLYTVCGVLGSLGISAIINKIKVYIVSKQK